jgi:hypothetical protein
LPGRTEETLGKTGIFGEEERQGGSVRKKR